MRSCHTSHIFHQCPTKKTLVSRLFRTGSYKSPSAALSARGHRMSPNALISSSREFPDAWWWMNKDIMSLCLYSFTIMDLFEHARVEIANYSSKVAPIFEKQVNLLWRGKTDHVSQRFYLFFKNGRPGPLTGKASARAVTMLQYLL